MQAIPSFRLLNLNNANQAKASKLNDTDFSLASAVDPAQLKALLASISSATDNLNSNDLNQLQAFLNQEGSNVTAPEVKNLLSAGVASKNLNKNDIQILAKLSSQLQNLPAEQKNTIGEQLLASATNLIEDGLSNDKGLSSSQVVAAKELLDTVKGTAISNKDTSYLTTSPTAPAIIIAGTPSSTPLNLSLAGSSFNLIGFLATNRGNMDSIMLAIITLLAYINNVQTPALQSLNSNYQTMENNIGAVTSGQNALIEITQFMAANASNLPKSGINVFAALDLALNPSPSSAIIPADQTSFYQNFVSNCPNFMSSLISSYSQYSASAGSAAESLDQIAAGDSPNSTPSLTAQAQIMAYFTAPANTSGVNISGEGSNPIFSNAWTNGTLNGGEGSAPSGLYVNASQPATVPATTLQFGAQLTFNTASVSQYIGSVGSTGQTGPGALGMMSLTLTNASVANNMIQTQIQYLTQSISGLWTLIGQQFIPNEKLPEM